MPKYIVRYVVNQVKTAIVEAKSKQEIQEAFVKDEWLPSTGTRISENLVCVTSISEVKDIAQTTDVIKRK